MAIAIHGLIDDAKCYQMVRDLRWPDGTRCPHCQSEQVVKNGHDTHEVERQRYLCRECGRSFDDLTNTVFAGHHQPLKIWMLCSYFMGLNLSNQQIAAELGLSKFQAHDMTKKLRQGVVDRQEPVVLEGEVECDEVYVVAGHKGQPDEVKKKGGRDDDAV
jgi:transposase-like protein